MNWFIAKISFQIVTSPDADSGQFEEQFRLLHAATIQEAHQKALVLGQQEEESFLNSKSRPVFWKFAGITELKEIREMKDGAEIFSTIIESSNPAEYLHIAAQRHQMISGKCNLQPVYALAG